MCSFENSPVVSGSLTATQDLMLGLFSNEFENGSHSDACRTCARRIAGQCVEFSASRTPAAEQGNGAWPGAISRRLEP